VPAIFSPPAGGVMPVILPARCERPGIRAVLGVAEHVSLLAVTRNAVALQVIDVS
jgi:hypothetical protein